MQFVRDSHEATDVIQTLRTAAPRDLLPATQLAFAVDWADVYLLSGLDSDLVEELFMVPLEKPAEVLRLLEGDGRCAFIESAHHVSARIGD